MLIAFLIIIYLSLYVFSWTNAIKMSEKTFSDEIQFSSLETITPQISDKSFNDFYEIAGNYAFYKMDDYSILHPMKYNSQNELYYVNRTFFSLVEKCSADTFSPPLTYTESDYCFRDYVERLNKLFEPFGFKVVEYKLYDGNISYIDPVTFNTSAKLKIVIKGKNAYLEKTINLSHTFNISGLVDPMTAREAYNIGLEKRVEKQIFYKDVKNFSPILVYYGNESDGFLGRGFFYGKLVAPSSAGSIDDEEKKYYILYGTYDDIISTAGYKLFGAYILTNAPDIIDGCGSEDNTFNALHYDNSCHLSYVSDTINKSFAVIPNFDPDNFRNNNVLFIAKDSQFDSEEEKGDGLKVYDIEDMRDYIICSYYIPSDRAPSFAQRLTENAPYLSSPYGIESTVLGRWAGGEYVPEYDKYSRIDFLFFRKEEGEKIRGLPGCKSFWMCNLSSSSENPLGHFVLDTESIEKFGLENITCNDGYAECED